LGLIVYVASPLPVQAATPGISVSPPTGVPGSWVTVTGSGFVGNETGIAVTYDGIPVARGITANPDGGWGATFVVSASTSGSHSIDAYGSVTTAASVPNVTFTVTPSISISRSSGAAGSSVTVTGSGFGASETGITVTYDGTPVAQSITANPQGGWSAAFEVPASTSGSHSIDAYGSVTTPASVPNMTFTVTAGISISRSSGVAGSSVTVTGSGFGASETGITVTYDGTPVAQDITANSEGGWSATFVVPASVSSSHSIGAYGSVTPVASIPKMTFTVTAGISISRSSGVGGAVTVTGLSFGASETGITVTYDGTPVAQGITANSDGGWSAAFVVPASASGSHSIDAYGSVTTAASVPNMTFTVTAGISISRSSGVAGSSVTVTGLGFGASETGITVTYDGTAVAQSITANPQGGWSAAFEVPASTSGSHKIGAYGSLTQTTSASEVGFNIGAAISVSHDYGYAGETVDVTGSGFSANAPIRLSYDDEEIPAQGETTDSSGSFGESITIPKSVHGPHTIMVTDNQNNSSKVTFTMESTPPAVPRPLSPGDGARIGLLGGIKPTLKWTGVTDPSGVTYTLEVDTSSDFSQPILQITDINGNSYTLTSAQALSRGEYYWRLEAIDGASNESGWSQPWLLKSGLMAPWTLAIIIILAVAAVGTIAYFLVVRLRRRRAQFIPVPAVDISEVTPGWLRLPQAEEAIKNKALPRRLALPQPTKRGKMMSGEELARLKVILDFAQSLPLAEAGYTVNWLVDLLQSSTGVEVSAPVYEQLLEGEVQVHYEPTWMRHPTYQELTTLLRGQPLLQDLNAFVDLVNRCASEATVLLQEIRRDAIAEIPSDSLAKGGWEFVSAIYSDALSWFLGKSLRDPAGKDYILKPGEEGGTIWLWGEDNTTFAVPLVQVLNENEASAARDLHLKLRRTYRNSDRARQLVSMMTQVEMQRDRLVNAFSQAFSQFARSIQ